jgi:hypothetical protein
MKNLIGKRFGDLLVTRKTNERENGYIVWECECDCGVITKVISGSLLSGKTRSCGCGVGNRILGKLTITDETKKIVEGCLLGDGCIRKQTKNSNGFFTYTTISKELAELVCKQTTIFKSKIYYNTGNNAFYVSTPVHPFFTEFYKLWYKNKKKTHIPEQCKLSKIHLLYLYMGDGHLAKNTKNTYKIVLSTNCFDDDSLNKLIYQLKTFLPFPNSVKIYERTDGKVICILRNDNVVSFLNYIGKCPVDDFSIAKKWNIGGDGSLESLKQEKECLVN